MHAPAAANTSVPSTAFDFTGTSPAVKFLHGEQTAAGVVADRKAGDFDHLLDDLLTAAAAATLGLQPEVRSPISVRPHWLTLDAPTIEGPAAHPGDADDPGSVSTQSAMAAAPTAATFQAAVAQQSGFAASLTPQIGEHEASAPTTSADVSGEPQLPVQQLNVAASPIGASDSSTAVAGKSLTPAEPRDNPAPQSELARHESISPRPGAVSGTVIPAVAGTPSDTWLGVPHRGDRATVDAATDFDPDGQTLIRKSTWRLQLAAVPATAAALAAVAVTVATPGSVATPDPASGHPPTSPKSLPSIGAREALSAPGTPEPQIEAPVPEAADANLVDSGIGVAMPEPGATASSRHPQNTPIDGVVALADAVQESADGNRLVPTPRPVSTGSLVAVHGPVPDATPAGSVSTAATTTDDASQTAGRQPARGNNSGWATRVPAAESDSQLFDAIQRSPDIHPVRPDGDPALPALSDTDQSAEVSLNTTSAALSQPGTDVVPAAADASESSVVHQVSEAVHTWGHALREQGSVRFATWLTPPELGQVWVELTRTASGLSARLSATDDGVHSLLQAQEPGLRQALANSGITVTELSIFGRSAGDSGFQQQQQSPEQDRESELPEPRLVSQSRRRGNSTRSGEIDVRA